MDGASPSLSIPQAGPLLPGTLGVLALTSFSLSAALFSPFAAHPSVLGIVAMGAPCKLRCLISSPWQPLHAPLAILQPLGGASSSTERHPPHIHSVLAAPRLP